MEHKVTFSIPDRKLGKASIVFKVLRGGERFGTLNISKGRLVWIPKGQQKGYRISWKSFDSFAQEQGKKKN